MEKTILILTLACLCLVSPTYSVKSLQQQKNQNQASSEEHDSQSDEMNNKIDPLKLTTYPPATDPRQFSYNINDGIEGAFQIRHETWENGVVKGYYTYPLENHMWELVHYIADAQGYRVTSTKSLTEAELLQMSDQKMNVGSANVELEEDGVKTNYKISKDDINKEKKPLPVPIPIQLKKARDAAEAQLAEEIKKKLDDKEKSDEKDQKLKKIRWTKVKRSRKRWRKFIIRF